MEASRSVSRRRHRQGVRGRVTRRRQRGGERDVTTGFDVITPSTGDESVDISSDDTPNVTTQGDDVVESTLDVADEVEGEDDGEESGGVMDTITRATQAVMGTSDDGEDDDEDDDRDEDDDGEDKGEGGEGENDDDDTVASGSVMDTITQAVMGTSDEDAGEDDEDEDDEGEGDDTAVSGGVMGTITRATQAVLGTPDEEEDDVKDDEDSSSGVDPTEDTILNLIKDYDFKDKNICLTKDLEQKVQAEDIVYSIGVNDGKYMKDYGENEPVLVVLYMFPNPLTTGMVISDDSTHLPLDGVIPAGHNARLRSRKMWVPFPGIPGVHIRIMCGVVETVKPVVSNEDVTLNSPVGIAIYSGKLGKIEKYYSGEELQSESKTMVRIGGESIDMEGQSRHTANE